MARKRRIASNVKKVQINATNCQISEAGPSEEKDEAPKPTLGTSEKPPSTGTGGRRKTKAENQAPLLPTRTSSRVPKKIKRDLSPPTSPCPPKKQAREPSAKNATSTPDAKNKRGAAKQEPRQRRPWEQWSVTDKNLFFHGLLEFGKDFDPLTNYVAVRQKKRLGLPLTMIKNKEQIRHFYYRTWHKISKWINPVPEIKKQTMELYGLINYNELRKHLRGRLDEKTAVLLNELIHKGSTQIRIKGKLHRLKTPMCRALKRINGVEDPKDDAQAKLPQKVTLELRPKTNESWAYVQGLSQNPRVRMTLRLDRRLSTVVSYLERKWKPHRLNIREKLKLSCESTRSIKISPPDGCTIVQTTLKNKPPPKKIDIALDCHAENLRAVGCDPMIGNKKTGRGKNQASAKNQSAISSIPAVKDFQENAVFPQSAIAKQATLTPDLNSGEGTSSGTLDFSNTVSFNGGVMEFSLSSVDSLLGSEKVDVDKICPIVVDVKNGCVLGEGKVNVDKMFPSSKSECAKAASSVKSDSSASAVSANLENSNKVDNVTGGKVVIVGKSAPAEKVSEKKSSSACSKADDKKTDADELNVGGLIEYATEENKVDVLTFEQKFRAGWLLEDAKCITMAEIYLALGNPETVVLEYECFDREPPRKVTPPNIPAEVLGISSVKPAGCDVNIERNNLAGLLHKLVLLATTEFVDFSKAKQASSSSPSRCSCGAIIKNSGGSPGKSSSKSPISSQGRSPATPKGQGRRGSKSKKEKDALQKEQQPPQPNAASGTSGDKTSDPHATKSRDPVFRVPLSVPVKATSYTSHQSLINQNNKAVLATAAEENNRARQFIQQFDSLVPKKDGMLKRPLMRKRTVRKPMLVQRTILPKAHIPGHHGMVPLLPMNHTVENKNGQYVPTVSRNPMTGRLTDTVATRTLIAQPLSFSQNHAAPNHSQQLSCRPVLRKIAPSTTGAMTDGGYTCTSTLSVPGSTNLQPISQPSPVTTLNESPQSSVLKPLSVEVPKDPDHVTPVTVAITATCSTPVKSDSLILSSSPMVASTLDISSSSISSFLNMSIPETEVSMAQDGGLITLDLGNTTFTDFLNAEKMSLPGLASPQVRVEPKMEVIQSPFKGELTWLQGEGSSDISLSSFLDSPLKRQVDHNVVSTQAAPFFCDNSRDSIPSKFDVDMTLQCMMNESSVDYVSKFADLAAQIAAVPDHSQQDTKNTS